MKGLVPVAILLIGRRRPREHPKGTSGEKAPLGRILRNLWLRMRTPKGTPKSSRDLMSLPVAMVLVLLYYILYYYYSKLKKGRETLTSGHVTDVISGQGRFR